MAGYKVGGTIDVPLVGESMRLLPVGMEYPLTLHVNRPLELVGSKKIHYLSVPPGSGKTHYITKRIAKRILNGKNTMYVAPTVQLLGEVQYKIQRMLERTGKYTESESFEAAKLMHTENGFNSESVVNYIAANNGSGEGKAYLITHAMFMNMDLKVEHKKDLVLYFDEASEISISELSVSLPTDSLNFFREKAFVGIHLRDEQLLKDVMAGKVKEIREEDCYDYMQLRLTENASFYMFFTSVIKYRQAQGLSEAEARRQTGRDHIEKLLDFARDPRFSVYMMGRDRVLSFFSYISPVNYFDGFRKVVLSSAFFELSELFSIMKRTHKLVDISHKINSERVLGIHDNFSRLIIQPIVEDARDLSMNRLRNIVADFSDPATKLEPLDKLMNKAVDQYTTRKSSNARAIRLMLADVRDCRMDRYHQQVSDIVVEIANKGYKIDAPVIFLIKKARDYLRSKGEKFSLLSINRENEKGFDRMLKAPATDRDFADSNIFHRISVKSHGLNSFSWYKSIAFLAALNPTNSLVSFYSQFIPEYDANLQWVASSILQSVTRTAIRDPNYKGEIHLVVYSTKTANTLVKVVQEFLDATPTVNEPLTRISPVSEYRYLQHDRGEKRVTFGVVKKRVKRDWLKGTVYNSPCPKGSKFKKEYEESRRGFNYITSKHARLSKKYKSDPEKFKAYQEEFKISQDAAKAEFLYYVLLVVNELSLEYRRPNGVENLLTEHGFAVPEKPIL